MKVTMIYECRLCGKRFTKETSTYKPAFPVLYGGTYEEHTCEDGAQGLGEFIGLKINDKKED